MRHKWMAALVVAITTLTTAQEAFKQYDSLKEQAATWATLRLWTGFLSTYTPPDEPLRAQQQHAACNDDRPQPQGQIAVAVRPARTIKMESARSHRQEASSPGPSSVEALPSEDKHREAAIKAVREALASIGEVALLDERMVRESEVAVERAGESPEPVGAPETEQDNADVDLMGHTLQKVRLAYAPRAQSQQKARAMKRALRVLQIRLERAARQPQELSRADVEVEIELPHELSPTLSRPGDENSLAAYLGATAVQAQPATSPLPATPVTMGVCAGE